LIEKFTYASVWDLGEGLGGGRLGLVRSMAAEQLVGADDADGHVDELERPGETQDQAEGEDPPFVDQEVAGDEDG
jgi:hypothetical protein